MILKRVGEECGGFVAVDDRTKTMGEIQWSRLLVKTRGDFRPSVLEIEVEEDVYVLSLWWEVRPVVRMKHNEASGRKSDEVRGDVISRAEQHVEKELVSARLETLNLPAAVRGARENGSGRELGNRVQGLVTRDWALIDGLASGSSSLGLIVGLKEARRANGPVKWVQFRDGAFVAWDSEDLRKQQMNACFSMTDRALEEEALRYDSTFYSRGKWILGTSHLISLYSDWASEGESFDCSGDIEEESWGDKTTWLAVYEGPAENDNVCWDLGEANRISDKVRGTKRDSSTPENQAMGKEKEEKWEESSLAKFSQFLGFSAEGLEKEILSFLIKIRKRREKIHNKDLLEKSKFERELKRHCEKFRLWEILDWRALNAEGAVGGILICWDKRSLDILNWEEGQFTLSCRFKIVENGVVWVFTRVYGLFTKVERDGMWEEFGAIRGLWEDP
ncbi:hypothetical protein CK203_010783 [Vitis vinifera]|uniref:DUF4283 domain-containing protein n=1 Tax=Vitis vinifera TaxID=29760 RepID=A0A438JT83_VITVI|nr:hypothetical protein CK203_010783 [Vitis vinifera]